MSDNELIIMALYFWINKLNTGCSTVSKSDFLNSGKGLNDLPKLSLDQRRSVERLEEIKLKLTKQR